MIRFNLAHTASLINYKYLILICNKYFGIFVELNIPISSVDSVNSTFIMKWLRSEWAEFRTISSAENTVRRYNLNKLKVVIS